MIERSLTIGGSDERTDERSADPEAALVVAAKRDPAAFELLYRRYVDAVYRYCWRRVGDEEAAADATSAVFARALAGLGGFRDGSFRAWLFTIAHNVVANQHRDRRPMRPLAEAEEVVDPSPRPEEVALAEERRRTLSRLLRELPPDYRTAIELRLAGLTGAEIAVAMGRSHTAVRLLQHRALSRLRALAGDDFDGGS